MSSHTKMPHQMANGIRWMVGKDIPEVLEIDRDSQDTAAGLEVWPEHVLRIRFDRKSCVGLVAIVKKCVVGFLLYETNTRGAVRLLKLVVDPTARMRGIGAALVRDLRRRTWHGDLTHAAVEVSEHNLVAQLFLRSQDFKATRVVRHHGEPDTIWFASRLGVPRYQGKNRVAEYFGLPPDETPEPPAQPDEHRCGEGI